MNLALMVLLLVVTVIANAQDARAASPAASIANPCALANGGCQGTCEVEGGVVALCACSNGPVRADGKTCVNGAPDDAFVPPPASSLSGAPPSPQLQCPNDCSSHGECDTTTGACKCDATYLAPSCLYQGVLADTEEDRAEADNDEGSLLPGLWMAVGAVIGCICLERLVSSCRRVYKRRQGRAGFSTVFQPEDDEMSELGGLNSTRVGTDDDWDGDSIDMN
jgi:hypothetical protein